MDATGRGADPARLVRRRRGSCAGGGTARGTSTHPRPPATAPRSLLPKVSGIGFPAHRSGAPTSAPAAFAAARREPAAARGRGLATDRGSAGRANLPAAWVRTHRSGRWRRAEACGAANPRPLHRDRSGARRLFLTARIVILGIGDASGQFQTRRLCIRPAVFTLYRRRLGAAEVRSCAFTARGAQNLYAASPLAFPRRRRRGRDLCHSIPAH